MQEILIKRRVVHISGYDPIHPEAFFRRFNRELARSAGCWNAKASTRDFVIEDDHARWITVLEGPGWQSQTVFELVRWDDVIFAHRKAPLSSRALGGVAAFFDFLADGVLWRYLTIAWRYAGFFLYPWIALAAVFTLVLMLVSHGAQALQASAILSSLLGLGAASLASYMLVARTHIGHLLDDWNFARTILGHADPVISERLNAAASRAVAVEDDVHVLVVGHSLGTVLAAQMLAHSVSLPGSTRKFGFLALGSSILKLALHSKAAMLRAQLQTMNTSGSVAWMEYQSLSDVMNFYKSDPVKLLKLDGPSPIVRQVRFSRMLRPEFYNEIKLNFFRLHGQFVSGNDLRANYDYIIANCGPFDPQALALSPDGAISWLDESGRLTPNGFSALLPSTTDQAANKP